MLLIFTPKYVGKMKPNFHLLFCTFFQMAWFNSMDQPDIVVCRCHQPAEAIESLSSQEKFWVWNAEEAANLTDRCKQNKDTLDPASSGILKQKPRKSICFGISLSFVLFLCVWHFQTSIPGGISIPAFNEDPIKKIHIGDIGQDPHRFNWHLRIQFSLV